MGGAVAVAVRRKGVVRTVHLGKGAVLALSDVAFFDNPALSAFWQHSNKPPKGAKPYPGWFDTACDEAFAPEDYGLMVIDFDTKWVGHLQGYAHPTHLTATIKAPPARAPASFKQGDSDFAVCLRGARKGRVSYARFFDTPAGVNVGQRHRYEPIALSETDGSSLVEDIQRAKEAADAWIVAQGYTPVDSFNFIDTALPKGWTLSQFSDAKEESGWSEFINALLDKGWEVSPQDVPHWSEFMQKKGYINTDVSVLMAIHRERDLEEALPEAPPTQAPRPRM